MTEVISRFVATSTGRPGYKEGGSADEPMSEPEQKKIASGAKLADADL